MPSRPSTSPWWKPRSSSSVSSCAWLRSPGRSSTAGAAGSTAGLDGSPGACVACAVPPADHGVHGDQGGLLRLGGGDGEQRAWSRRTPRCWQAAPGRLHQRAGRAGRQHVLRQQRDVVARLTTLPSSASRSISGLTRPTISAGAGQGDPAGGQHRRRRPPSPGRRRAARGCPAAGRRRRAAPGWRPARRAPRSPAVVRRPVSRTGSPGRRPSAVSTSGCSRTMPRRASSAAGRRLAVRVRDGWVTSGSLSTPRSSQLPEPRVGGARRLPEPEGRLPEPAGGPGAPAS